MKKALLVFTFLLFSVITYAQFTIAGKVLNAADKKPVESATVFVNNTSYGAKTDKQGDFIIRDVQAGQYDLIISVVGFKTQKASVTVKANVTVPPITITEREFELNEVKITRSKRVDNKYLEIFKREILGTSKFARECRINNPKVIQLYFDKSENRLSAYTSDFMIVENRALGYRLRYLVEDFERNEKTALLRYIGYVLFEEMSGDEKQQQKWYANRLAVYEGSMPHFFRSLLGNKVNLESEPGFLVRTITRVVNPYRPADTLLRQKLRYYSNLKGRSNRDSLIFWRNQNNTPRYIEVIDTTRLQATDILQNTDQKDLYALAVKSTNYLKIWDIVKVPGMGGSPKFKCDTCNYKNGLYISYLEKISPQLKSKGRTRALFSNKSFTPNTEIKKKASVITPDETVFFDRNGIISNPMSLRIEGYWEKQRVGDLLPVDYLPNTGVIGNASSVAN